VELRHLRYFVAVAEALSFRRAAEHLHVAQPALSRQIKDLEHAVGARLLNRNTGGVMLTDAGMVLLEEARDILERLGMAAAAARDAAAGRGGKLTVGNLGAMSAGFLPATLSAFRMRFPQVEVNLHEMGLPEQLAALQAGSIQVGFTIDPGETPPAGLEWAEVLTSSVAVAMGRDHPLARKPRIALGELVTEQFFCIGETERHNLHRQRIEAIFAARGLKHRPIRRVNSFESLIAMVGGDHGLSVMLPVARNPENVVFRRIKEDGDDLVVRLSAVWRKGVESQLARNFVTVLREVSAPCRSGARGPGPAKPVNSHRDRAA
jgi:DNA-binding transcriptional LysR family regulator